VLSACFQKVNFLFFSVLIKWCWGGVVLVGRKKGEEERKGVVCDSEAKCFVFGLFNSRQHPFSLLHTLDELTQNI